MQAILPSRAEAEAATCGLDPTNSLVSRHAPVQNIGKNTLPKMQHIVFRPTNRGSTRKVVGEHKHKYSCA